jgi:hypothetical protein
MPESTFVLRAARLDARDALESLMDAVWRTRPGPTVTVQLVRDADEGRTFTRAADIDANFEVLSRRLLELLPDLEVIIAPRAPGPPPVRMWTNREFYDFVEALPETKRSLETYLRALAALLVPYRGEPGLALEVFADLVEAALESEPATGPSDAPNEVERLLWHQISELPRLKGKGAYAVVKGSDSRWYNTSVVSFLSAGASGAWNGFQAEGEDLEYMPFRSWHEIRDFFRNGQWYE